MNNPPINEQNEQEKESKIAAAQYRLVQTLFLISAGIVFALCLYTGIKLSNISAYTYLEVEERLLTLSRYAATLVSAEELNELQTPEDMEKPLFGELRQRLFDFVAENGILFVYYYRNNSDNMVQAILDNDTTDESYNLSTEPFAWEEVAQKALEGSSSVTALRHYSLGYEHLISAFSPVFDENGSVIAVAGVDLGDEQIITIRTTMNALVPLLSAGMLIVILCGLLNVSLHGRSDKARAKALNAAQAASKAKTSFLANMSHEMRTPLNAIIGLSELTLDTGEPDLETRSNLGKIYNAGLTLLSTVNDVLDISKIEAGKFEIVPIEYDIPSLLNDTITQSIMHIGEKPLRFILDIDENLPNRLFGDDLRIKQVFNNLLSNAFKYTRQGSVKLRVRCTREGETVWMTASVHDTGIGIRPEDIDGVFSDYTKVDTTANRNIMGTGLGMPITKRVVEMMGGALTVESEYGKGSVFTMKIRQKYVNDVVIGKKVADSLMAFEYSDQRRKNNAGLVRIKLPYARVLVVDDVATNLDVAKGMMKPYGMQIDCLTSGQQAIDAVRAEKVRYNTIFMDHMMPDMDGIEATRIIRNDIGTEYAKTVPIIALTANAIVGNEDIFLSKGFQAFLSKPIDMSRLDAIIRQWVRNKELEEKLGVKEEQAAPPPEKPARSFPLQVEGVDLQQGLNNFGGDEDSYLNVLRSYAANTRPLLEKAKNADRDNLANYAIIAHGIKGSSRGICADIIGDKAEALEKAAKAGDFEFVMANNAAFIEAAQKLVGDLEILLKKMAEEEDAKPAKEKPDGEALRRLQAACESGDIDDVDKVMAEINSYAYTSDDGLTAWLRDNVQQMSYDTITEKLKGM